MLTVRRAPVWRVSDRSGRTSEADARWARRDRDRVAARPVGRWTCAGAGPRDRSACAAVAEASFRDDGYPKYHPGDFGAFMFHPGARWPEWVAVDGRVGGGPRGPAPPDAAAAHGPGRPHAWVFPKTGSAWWRRVLVAPTGSVVRASGAVSLAAAAGAAAGNGLHPVLDVGTMLGGHVRSTKRGAGSGWASAPVDLGDGQTIDERVYARPAMLGA